MLREATGFKHIYLATGRTDLRKGQDSLLMQPGNIFLFCGRRNHVIKALVFENDGFVLLTKRLIRGHYQWPRNRRETLDISEEQYHDLLDGFAVESRSTIEKIDRLYI